MLHLEGQRFGRLVAISRLERKTPGESSYSWQCQCDCGNQIAVVGSRLRSGNVRSCGCLQAEARRVDATGRAYNMLTAGEWTGRTGPGGAIWRWRCACGNEVEAGLSAVSHGYRKSCGCDGLRVKLEQVEAMRQRQDYRDETLVDSIRKNTVAVNNTSGVRGVTWHRGIGKWQVRIMFRGISHHIGYYDDLNDAAAARKQGEAKYYGEYLESIGEQRNEHDTAGHAQDDHPE